MDGCGVYIAYLFQKADKGLRVVTGPILFRWRVHIATQCGD